MKRSEMLEKLVGDLKDINYENYIDEKGFEWCANLILLSIEESGMLPPVYNNTTTGINQIYPMHKWEEE